MYTRQPLVFRMWPRYLDGITGQQHLIDEDKVLHRCVLGKHLFSMIFHEPPDIGKTTLAMVLADKLELPFHIFDATTGGKKDLEAISQEVKFYEGLIVIIDEVHRSNKDKQNLLLPRVEDDNITLIGATTSNPLHAVNPAIRSRCHLFEIKQAQQGNTEQTLMKAIHHQDSLNDSVQTEEEALHIIVRRNSGSIRCSLDIPEICALASDSVIIRELVSQYSQLPNMSIDSDGDGYYDILSRFQESIQGSGVDAALYYLGIMIGADDVDSIKHRLPATAYEDIGLGNSTAVARCTTVVGVVKRVDSSETHIIPVVAAIDLTLSPESESAEHTVDAAMSTLRRTSCSVPDCLRFTPTNMDDDKKYDHGRSGLWNRIQYLSDRLKNRHFYEPELTSSYKKILMQDLEKPHKVLRMNNLKTLKGQDSR